MAGGTLHAMALPRSYNDLMKAAAAVPVRPGWRHPASPSNQDYSLSWDPCTDPSDCLHVLS